MWNKVFIIIIGILFSFAILTPSQSMGVVQDEVTWQLGELEEAGDYFEIANQMKLE